MRKLNVLEFVSLDGVIQGPGGPEEDRSGGFAYGGWTHPHSDAVSSAAMKKQMSLPKGRESEMPAPSGFVPTRHNKIT